MDDAFATEDGGEVITYFMSDGAHNQGTFDSSDWQDFIAGQQSAAANTLELILRDTYQEISHA